MSVKRFDARRDATEPAIRDALKAVGAKYEALDPFDLLVLYRGTLTMLDCKTPKGKPTKKQQELIDAGWPLKFAVTPEEALKAIGAVKA